MNKSVVYCPKCMSFNLMVLRANGQYDKLCCNDCGWDEYLMNKEQAIDMMKRINQKEKTMNKNVKCENCLSSQMRVDTFPSGAGTLICNECDYKSSLSREEVSNLLDEAGWFDSFKPKSVMQATICYDSIESASGPMTLKMLYDAVTEAMEKGMPMDSEVFESHTESPIEGVRFLYETDSVEPIQCGEHMVSDYTDLVINTHVCGEEA